MSFALSKLRWFRTPPGTLTFVLLIFISVVGLFQFVSLHTGTDTLSVAGKYFSLEVANTQQERELGLGNRTSLPGNQGMLFVFDQSTPECFWMRDMHFPLDMVWLSTSKQIVYMKQYVSPDTYPQSFCSAQPAKYVIELNAGEVASTNMQTGEKLSF